MNGPAISNIAFTKDGKLFVVTGDSYTAFSSYTNAFDKSNAKNITSTIKGKAITLNTPDAKPVVLKGHKANVLNVIINKEGTIAVSNADEPLIIVWNTLTGAIL